MVITPQSSSAVTSRGLFDESRWINAFLWSASFHSSTASKRDENSLLMALHWKTINSSSFRICRSLSSIQLVESKFMNENLNAACLIRLGSGPDVPCSTWLQALVMKKSLAPHFPIKIQTWSPASLLTTTRQPDISQSASVLRAQSCKASATSIIISLRSSHGSGAVAIYPLLQFQVQSP